jgi:transcriptional regulator with XRE-family HTH domain
VKGKAGAWVRKRRKENALTLATLSGAAGVSLTQLSDLERGVRPMPERVAMALGPLLGIHPAELLAMDGRLTSRAARALQSRPDVAILLDKEGPEGPEER